MDKLTVTDAFGNVDSPATPGHSDDNGSNTSVQAEPAKGQSDVQRASSSYLERFGVILIGGTIVVVFSFLKPHSFATLTNFRTILGTQAVLLVLTLGLLVPMIVGEFDLSIASMMSFSAMVVAELSGVHHVSMVLAVTITLALGILVGLVNSYVVVRLGVSSFITTLGVGTLLGGLSYGISGSQTIGNIPESLLSFSGHGIFGLPMVFYYGVVLCVLVWYVFDYTPLGRHLMFVGEGREVARLTGLPVAGIRVGSLTVSALIASFAGILQAGVVGAAEPGGGSSYLLPAFAAAFLGATTIRPGRLNAWGTFIAVYFLATGITGLELLGYTGWVQDVFYGGALVLAVALGRIVASSRASAKSRIRGFGIIRHRLQRGSWASA